MTVVATEASRLHLDYVDGMRAVAALVVLLNHVYAQAWCPFYGQFPPPELALLSYTLAIGHLAVSVFIVISGFCLYLPVTRAGGLLKGGAIEFLRRRCRRILPPYYAALALALLLIATVIGEPSGSLWDVSAVVRPTDVASHVLLLQNFFGTGRINYVFWSIALEWQIYLVFPLIVLAFRRWSVAGSVLVALAVGYTLTFTPFRRVAQANLHYLGLFTFGMVAARVAFTATPAMARLRERVPWGLVAGGTLAGATMLILAWGWRSSTERWPLLDLIVGVGAAALLLAAARSAGGPVSRAFSLRPLPWIGRFSYSLYLIHAPLLQCLWQFALKPLGLGGSQVFFVLMLAGAPLIVGASYLFFLAFERPFISSPARVPSALPAAS